MSASGLYRLANSGWNYSRDACRVLSPLRNTRHAVGYYGNKTWSNTQNRKYITCHNAARAGPSHDHRQRAQKLGEVRPCDFRVMLSERQTNKQTNRHTHHDTSCPSLRRSTGNNFCYSTTFRLCYSNDSTTPVNNRCIYQIVTGLNILHRHLNQQFPDRRIKYCSRLFKRICPH